MKTKVKTRTTNLVLWFWVMFETTLGASRTATPGLAPNEKIGDYAGINRSLVL